MMFGLFFQYLKQILFFVYFWLDFLHEKFFRETRFSSSMLRRIKIIFGRDECFVAEQKERSDRERRHESLKLDLVCSCWLYIVCLLFHFIITY